MLIYVTLYSIVWNGRFHPLSETRCLTPFICNTIVKERLEHSTLIWPQNGTKITKLKYQSL
jgi:hypothetical protein